MKEKIEIKPLEQKREEKEPFDTVQDKIDKTSEIGTWEDEGGAVEIQRKDNIETRALPRGKWWIIIGRYKEEFPETIQNLIKLGGHGGVFSQLSNEKKEKLYNFRDQWWLQKFGISFHDWFWSEHNKKGGTTETQTEWLTPAEVPETVVEEEQVKSAWQELIAQAKEEFPENIKSIIDKVNRIKKIKGEEWSQLDNFSQTWFRETFGIVKKKQLQRELTPEELEEKKKRKENEKERNKKRTAQKREKKKRPQLQELAKQKRIKMEKLHRALRNLDAGESVEEFIDETRRVVYFDEEEQQYFAEENGGRKDIDIGDIVSDYAWGIKYFPDSGMVDPTAYRTLAKRILVNETRRDLEKIHNKELVTVNPEWAGAAFSFTNYFQNLKQEIQKKEGTRKVEEILKEFSGFAAEVAVREYLSRIASSLGLDFFVSRATVQEDAEFKYDFKIRLKHRIRGVDVESKDIKSIGFQLKTGTQYERISTSRYVEGKKVQVEDVIKISMPGKEIRDAVKKWLEVGEPSGGPEQFLSRDLKIDILKAVTEKLTDIPQEVFDKIN